jgi:intracellular septation protein
MRPRLQRSDSPTWRVWYYDATSRHWLPYVKQFIDFIPLILFFIVYKISPRTVEVAGESFPFGGIFSATAVLIVSSVLVYGVLYLVQKRLEKSQWLTLLACLLFGSLTLAFHSETFLKWKAPVVNWLFATGFAASHFIGDKVLVKRIMGHAIKLPEQIWTRLNLAWVVFFLFSGAANLFVAFTFHEIWVDFKVFGSLGMTVLFLIGQGLYLARHMQDTQTDAPLDSPKD